MRYINPAYSDMRTKQYLEIWVKGDKGTITVDLGRVSEDANGDGILNSEDLEVNGIRDGILTEAEDIGVDNRNDRQELAYYVHLAGIDTIGMSESQMRAQFVLYYPDRDPNDPEGDNWNWTDRAIYTRINGTEGNREDPEGGKTPDTEDLNNNNYLDRRNDYYSFSIDLSSEYFLVDDTRSDPSVFGSWRLYRIPIQDSLFTFVEDGKVFQRTRIGSPNFENIEYVRLALTGLTTPERIQIASLKLVGSSWLEGFENFHVLKRTLMRIRIITVLRESQALQMHKQALKAQSNP